MILLSFSHLRRKKMWNNKQQRLGYLRKMRRETWFAIERNMAELVKIDAEVDRLQRPDQTFANTTEVK
jgi:hypothetical protein